VADKTSLKSAYLQEQKNRVIRDSVHTESTALKTYFKTSDKLTSGQKTHDIYV